MTEVEKRIELLPWDSETRAFTNVQTELDLVYRGVMERFFTPTQINDVDARQAALNEASVSFYSNMTEAEYEQLQKVEVPPETIDNDPDSEFLEVEIAIQGKIRNDIVPLSGYELVVYRGAGASIVTPMRRRMREEISYLHTAFFQPEEEGLKRTTRVTATREDMPNMDDLPDLTVGLVVNAMGNAVELLNQIKDLPKEQLMDELNLADDDK